MANTTITERQAAMISGLIVGQIQTMKSMQKMPDEALQEILPKLLTDDKYMHFIKQMGREDMIPTDIKKLREIFQWNIDTGISILKKFQWDFPGMETGLSFC